MSDEYDGPEDTEGIAVIGMAGRFPGARHIGEFWDNLCGGRESVEDVDESELRAAGVPEHVLADPGYVRRAAALDGYDEFDAEFFGFPPATAATMDPQQRLFLQCCWHALEDAGHDPGRYDGPIGVFASGSFSGYLAYHLLSHRDPREILGAGTSTELIQTLATNDLNFLATRAAHTFDLRGPALTVQTACSSSLVALHLACQSLLCGESDMALAGGISVKVPHRVGYVYDSDSMMSADGRCRPFDAAANGTVFGSGGGVVLLKRLSDALADGDHVRAVVRGSAVNNDGSLKMSYSAPSVEMQAAVVAEALAVAGVDPGSVSYIEAHGTGTALGDPIEVAALRKALDPDGTRAERCAIGSAKGNIGHLEAASGITGLIKTVLALEHRLLPGTAHFGSPNPELRLDGTPFVIQQRLEKWTGEGPLRAGVSSLGVGGTNVHVVVEEAPPASVEPSTAEDHPEVLLLSAGSAEALREARDDLAHHLRQEPATDLAGVAFTLAEGRRALPHRYAVAAKAIQQAAEELESEEGGIRALDTEPTKVLLFPGQGAQYPGMTSGLYRADPVFRREVDACARLFAAQGLADIREVMFGSDEQLLQRTDHAQAALFTAQYALARTLETYELRPDAVAGHSIGEYAAACLAGVMELPEAVRLVAARGRIMSSAPPGAMLAIRLPEEEIAGLLEGTGLEISAVNEPRGGVIGGTREEVGRLERTLRAREIPVSVLHTAHAFHTAALAEAADRFAEAFASVHLAAPSIPLASNVTGDWMTDAEATDPERWARQIRLPVRWADVMTRLLAEPGCLLVETGPGRSLITTARRSTAWSSECRAVQTVRHPADEGDDHEVLLTALGRAWASGATIDWTRAREGRPGRRVPLPGHPFRRTRHWRDSAYVTGTGSRTAPELPSALATSRPTDVVTEPDTSAEELLTAVFAEVLGFEEIGRHDSFFDLGGDSVLATQIASRARARGLDFRPRDMFDNPTIARLAQVAVRREGLSPASADVYTDPTAPLALTPEQVRWTAQEGLGLEPGEASAFVVEGSLTKDLLEEALGHLVAHHDVLGLRLRRLEEAWEQRPTAIPWLPAHRLAEGDDRSVIGDLRRADVNDAGHAALSAGLTEGGRCLVLLHHPALLDRRSERILADDLRTACRQLLQGRPVELPDATTPWRAWAARRLSADPVPPEEREYWLDLVRRADPDPLPARPRAENGPAEPRRQRLTLDETVSAAVVAHARTRRVLVGDVILATLANALTALFGARRRLIDVVGSARTTHGADVDLSRTPGAFSTEYPVLVDPDSTVATPPYLRELLRGVPRQGLGYESMRHGDGAAAKTFAGLAQAEVLFADLGVLRGGTESASGLLSPVLAEWTGPAAVPGALRHPLEVRPYQRDGLLTVDCWYDAARWDSEPASSILARIEEALVSLVGG